MGYNGLPVVFTSTATAALEVGAMSYAQGVIDNQFRFYIRDDGMLWHSSDEIPASARMLTILALYHSYSGDDGSFILQYFAKARALADLLLARHSASLQYGKADPRYGIPAGGDDALHSDQPLTELMNHELQPKHWYASAAELYRACLEMGSTWSAVGKSMHRADVSAHGAQLSALAPQILQQLQSSLNKTVTTSGPDTCWAQTVERDESSSTSTASFRGFSEMLYSGALSSQQVAEIYQSASGSSCGARLLVLGSPALGGTSLSTPTVYGLAYGLLQHDMIDKFLLHYFVMSAHGYTRGSFTTPESSNVADRDVPTLAYAAAGEVIAPTYLKWMLCFEEPESRTLWLAKATPRAWLAPGEATLQAANLTTRYGRVSFSMAAQMNADSSAYTVHASVVLPASVVNSAPSGGIRLRIRAPIEHAGKLSNVTIGGKMWSAFSAAEETIDIAASELTANLITDGLPHIVATFA